MDAMTMRIVVDGFAWIGDMAPVLVAPLIVLLLYELVVLIAAAIGTRPQAPAPGRTRRSGG